MGRPRDTRQHESLFTQIERLTDSPAASSGEKLPGILTTGKVTGRWLSSPAKDPREPKIEIGVAARSRKLLGLTQMAAGSAEELVWVTDNSCEPPVTRMALRSILGCHVALVEDKRPTVMHSFDSAEGAEIVNDMSQLVSAKFNNQAPNADEKVVLSPSAAIVGGLA